MIDFMFIFLFIIVITGAICYTAGYFSGRAIEEKRIDDFSQKYFLESQGFDEDK